MLLTCLSGVSFNPFTANGQSAVAQGATAPAVPGTRSRPWDAGFLDRFYSVSPGEAIQIELVEAAQASGVIRHIERTGDNVRYLAGELEQPAPGRFFFQRQTVVGKAGSFAGVVEFPSLQLAYRIQPSTSDGSPELVEMALSNVICQVLPPPDTAMESEEIPPLEPSDFPDYPIPDYQDGIIPLQSLPGSTAVLYMDYRGGYTPTWGGITYAKPNASNDQIRDVWKRVAEDYMPFNINVTTDIRVFESAPENTRQRCIVTPTTTAAPGAGGVAYLDSWNWTGDTPCWAFYSTGKSAAEVISHEVGHTLTLGHDGRTTPEEGYYGGQGSGAVGWAPIMGVGYYKNVAQWSKGEYLYANNTGEDDLADIVGKNDGVDYRTDDTGPVLASARFLEIYSNKTVFAEGVIERTGDIDAFKFTTTNTGLVSLTANPVGDWANLAMEATLYNSSETLISSNNPQTVLSASISATVPAGTYTFRIRGVGRNDPVNDGFSAYASLGYYSVAGSIASPVIPDRFSVAENSPSGTVVGTVAPTSSQDSRSFSIVSGNTGSAFSIDSAGVLRVANASALNYEALGANRQLAVQYDLLVNVVNLTNPALTELNRRVVVAVLDVNDAPTATPFNVTVLEHTAPGTVLGTVKGVDQDFYSILNYAIIGGDTNKVFAIGSQSGTLTIAGDLESSERSFYQLQVRVADVGFLSVTSVVNVTVIATQNPLTPGTVAYAQYREIDGNLVSALTASPNWPSRPTSAQYLTTLEGPNGVADRYGSVMRGYLIPPTTGTYFFYVASDDNSELWMSTSTNPAAMTRIAYISGEGSYTSVRQWNKFATQRSTARSLFAGYAYYFEVRHKEGGGGDHLAVGWTGPGITTTNVIPCLYVAPYDLNYYPTASGLSANVRRDLLEGGRIAQINISDPNPGQTFTCEILSGNEEGIFTVDNSGWIRVANSALLQSTSTTFFNLDVRITDNGAPALTVNATASLTVVEANAVLASSVKREMFLDIGNATAVSALTSNAKYPRAVDRLDDLTSFTTATSVADNYGSRVRALVTAPVSGNYRFYIASDDASQLKMSTTTNAAAAGVICSVSGWTDQDNWVDEAGQTSALRPLVAGQQYYIEALQKEGGGGDHLSVAWLTPDSATTNIIDAAYLSPFDISQAPLINSQTLRTFTVAPNGTRIGVVSASDSPLETLTFQITGGNTGNTFAIDPDSGTVRVADNTLLTGGTVSSFSLTVRVQDSGYQGLYPLRSSTATVTVLVQPTTVPLVWNGLGETNLWSDAGNWGGAVPWSGARLIFGLSARQVNLNDAASVLTSVAITNSGFSLSGNPVRLQSGLTNAGNSTWALNTTLSGQQTWQSSSGMLTIDAPITNGGFPVNLVANTGEIALRQPISGTGGLNKSGTARLLMTGPHYFTGTAIVQSAGTGTALEISGDWDLELSSDLTMNGRMDLWNHNARIGSLNGSGVVFANNSARVLTLGANNHSGVFSGVIQDSSWASGVTLHLVKTGTGAQTLSGNNTFSGSLTVQEGTLAVSSLNALGSTAGPTVVEPGATLSISGNLNLPAETLNLAGTGVSDIGALRSSSGGNTLNGPVILSAPAKIQVSAGLLTIKGAWTTSGHTVTLESLMGANLTVNSVIAGSGGLVKSGFGSLTLTAPNTYTGTTLIEGGTLSIGTGGNLPTTGMITVAPNATLNVGLAAQNWMLPASQALQLSGTLSGAATIEGTLSTGNSFGTASCTSNLVLNGSVNLKIGRFGGNLSNDVVNCQGTLIPGGTLNVANVGTDAFIAGDTFQLFAAGTFGAGAFTNINLPTLSGDLAWDTSTLASDGILRIPSGATAPTLAYTQEGNMLQLSWPAGFSLQAQTNTTGGLGPEWYPVETSGNSLTISIDRTNSSVFFRLISQ